jgi:hypothetical protein
VKTGRRPASKRKPKKDPASVIKEQQLTEPGDMPHSTHAALPVLNPQVEPPRQPTEPLDADDA